MRIRYPPIFLCNLEQNFTFFLPVNSQKYPSAIWKYSRTIGEYFRIIWEYSPAVQEYFRNDWEYSRTFRKYSRINGEYFPAVQEYCRISRLCIRKNDFVIDGYGSGIFLERDSYNGLMMVPAFGARLGGRRWFFL